MSTNQTLQQFYQSAQTYGFSRDYQARVTAIHLNGQVLGEDRLVYIKSMALPSKKAAISTVKYYGVDIHSTGTRNYGESEQWELTFLTDQTLYLKQWFEQRLEEVAANNPNRIKANPVSTTENFAQIEVLDDALETVATYKLNGLFVVSTPGITFNMDGTGKVQEFKVVLGYQYWESFNGTSPSYSTFGINGSNTNGGVNASGGAGASTGFGLNDVLNGLRTVTQVANTVKGTVNAIGGVANALNTTSNAIRRR